MKTIDAVREAQAGDTNAQAELYSQYYNSLYHFALKHTKNQADAQDAVQNGFIEAFQALSSLEDPKQSRWNVLSQKRRHNG